MQFTILSLCKLIHIFWHSQPNNRNLLLHLLLSVLHLVVSTTETPESTAGATNGIQVLVPTMIDRASYIVLYVKIVSKMNVFDIMIQWNDFLLIHFCIFFCVQCNITIFSPAYYNLSIYFILCLYYVANLLSAVDSVTVLFVSFYFHDACFKLSTAHFFILLALWLNRSC